MNVDFRGSSRYIRLSLRGITASRRVNVSQLVLEASSGEFTSLCSTLLMMLLARGAKRWYLHPLRHGILITCNNCDSRGSVKFL